MAVRLRVAELMEAKNLKATQLQAQLTMLTREPVYPATLRRYINSSTDGKPGGPPLRMVDIQLLSVMAKVFGVALADMFEAAPEELKPGPFVPAGSVRRRTRVART